jgi:hypothetical protein
MRIYLPNSLRIKLFVVTLCLFLPLWGVVVNAQSVSVLVDELRHPTWTVRRDAAKQLGALDWGDLTPDSSVIEALAACLSDREPAVRLAAATALGDIGPAAEEAVPALAKVFTNQNNSSDLRAAAVRALGFVGPAAGDAVPEMIGVLTNYHNRSDLRQAAAEALGAMGPAAHSAAPALAQSLADYNNTSAVRQAAATALGHVGSPNEETVHVLVDTLTDPDTTVREAAAGALEELRIEVTSVAPNVPTLDITAWRLTGVTLIPLRAVAEWLGASVAFDPLTRTVTVRDETHHIVLHIGATAAMVDGVDTQLPLPVFIFEEITMVPLRFLAESAGATVEWHAATQEIILSVPEKKARIQLPPTPPETEQALAEAAGLIPTNQEQPE